MHATLEALALLPRPDATQLKTVTITTHPRWLTVCNIAAPRTGLEAKFSYRLVAALSLLGHDTAALDTYSDALCTDPQITALRDCVTVQTDDTLKETEALVTLDTDGTFEAHFDLEAPMPLDTRATRLRAKAAALVGPDRAAALWQAIESGDRAAFSAEIAR